MTNMSPDHPHRDMVLDEIHARPIVLVPSLSRIRRLVYLPNGGPQGVASIQGAFRHHCLAIGRDAPAVDARFHSLSTERGAITWEFHTEFITVTWHSPLMDTEDENLPFGLSLLESVPLLAATRIDLIPDSKISSELLSTFRPASLCLVNLEDEKGQVATDFARGPLGYTRFEFASGSISELRRSVITRQLLDIETYRSVALLGLPLARSISPRLRGLEERLGAVVPKLGTATSPQLVNGLLEALHSLSVDSGQIAEELDFRFAASRAYGTLLGERLAGLQETPTNRGLSIASFIDNRVNPALATFSALEKRLGTLAMKIERTISLLNARIGLDIQTQNNSVLETIAKTARSQLQLQRTVEGLSTVAITYYLIGIASYAFTAPLEAIHVEKGFAFAAITPFALLGVWLSMRKIRRQHEFGGKGRL
jgi:uncharacterized membrane-anchored protein